MIRYNGYRYLVVGMFFMLLLFGTFVGVRYMMKSGQEEKSGEEVVTAVNNEEEENVDIYEEKLKDIKVIYEDYYSLCEETIDSEENYYKVDVEKLKENELEKQKKDGKKYSIVHEDDEKIVFKRTIENFCPNHFFIKYEDNGINIYRKITDKELEMYKKLKVSYQLVRDELKERLKEGIEADSKEELNLIIEDIES